MSRVAAALALFTGLVSLARPAAATTINDVCTVLTATTCNVNNSVAVDPNTVLDLGTRQMIVKGGKNLDVGIGILVVRAGSLVLQPNAKLLGAGGFISVTTTGSIDLQASGSTLSKIDVSDVDGGGSIDLNAGTTANVAGSLFARGSDTEADGGDIFLQAGGDVGVSAAPSAKGGGDAGGGSITILSGGAITMSAPMDVSGGEFDGGDIDLESTGDLTLLPAATIDISGGSLSGSGGSVTLISSVGAMTIGGKITATAGGSADEGGGFGGEVDATATAGALGLTANIDIFGGDGGGGGDGGDVSLIAGAALTVAGSIDSHGGQDTTSLGFGDGGGGSILLQGCDVTLPAGRTVNAHGTTFGLIDAKAGGQMTIAGTLLATQSNLLEYRDPTKPPLVTGSVSPAPVTTQSCLVPACAGVCGNHTIDICEACDDGNASSGDCCSASCTFEGAGASCSAGAGICDGAGHCAISTTTTTSTSTSTSSTTSTSTSTTTTSTTSTSTTSTSSSTTTSSSTSSTTSSSTSTSSTTSSSTSSTTSTSSTIATTTSTSTTSTSSSSSTSTSTTSTTTTSSSSTTSTSSSTTSTSTSTSSTTTVPTTSTTSTSTLPPARCGNGVVEAGETCDDGNARDGDCCSSSCQLEPAGSSCSDGNACTRADTCDGVGHCGAGTAITCDDGDLCTDDPVCNPATGCAASQPKTGEAGVTCHFDAISAMLAHAPADELNAAGRRLIDLALRKARTKVELAAQSTGKRGAKLLRGATTALRAVTKATNTARRKKQIESDLAASVVDQLNRALGGTQALH